MQVAHELPGHLEQFPRGPFRVTPGPGAFGGAVSSGYHDRSQPAKPFVEDAVDSVDLSTCMGLGYPAPESEA